MAAGKKTPEVTASAMAATSGVFIFFAALVNGGFLLFGHIVANALVRIFPQSRKLFIRPYCRHCIS